jgi:hypothetical protein
MKTIDKSTVHKLFRYGTHKQLENSVKRWLANGVATKTDIYYEVNDDLVNNAMQIEINVSEHKGQVTYKTGAVIVPDDSGWYLLGASL